MGECGADACNDDDDDDDDDVDRPVDRCLMSLSGPPINTSANLGELPGQRYAPDQQCQLIYGQQSYYCGVSRRVVQCSVSNQSISNRLLIDHIFALRQSLDHRKHAVLSRSYRNSIRAGVRLK